MAQKTINSNHLLLETIVMISNKSRAFTLGYIFTYLYVHFFIQLLYQLHVELENLKRSL